MFWFKVVCIFTLPRAIEKELLPVVQSVERAGPEAITVFKQRRVASGCGASGARAGGRDHTRNQAPFYEFATKIKGKKETRAKCHSLHILTTMFRALGKKEEESSLPMSWQEKMEGACPWWWRGRAAGCSDGKLLALFKEPVLLTRLTKDSPKWDSEVASYYFDQIMS